MHASREMGGGGGGGVAVMIDRPAMSAPWKHRHFVPRFRLKSYCCVASVPCCRFQIGFIGLGNMGSNMAARLMDAGHQLTVFDVNKAAVDAAAAQGAAVADNPAAVAATGGLSAIITMLPSSSHVMDVYCSEVQPVPLLYECLPACLSCPTPYPVPYCLLRTRYYLCRSCQAGAVLWNPRCSPTHGIAVRVLVLCLHPPLRPSVQPSVPLTCPSVHPCTHPSVLLTRCDPLNILDTSEARDLLSPRRRLGPAPRGLLYH